MRKLKQEEKYKKLDQQQSREYKNKLWWKYSNEHRHRGRIEIENYISLFFHLTSCWDWEALILLVMLGSKQLQWINKITHLDMPVNLIILEQGEGLGNRTKAIRLTEAKTRAAMVAEHNSFLKQIFLFPFVTYCRFCSSAVWRQWCFLCCGRKKIISLHRREACATGSNAILQSDINHCRICSKASSYNQMHFSSILWFHFRPKTWSLCKNGTLWRLLSFQQAVQPL